MSNLSKDDRCSSRIPTSLTVGPLSHHFRCVKEAHRAVKNQVQILYRVVNDAPHTLLRLLFYNTTQLHSAHINTILITKIEEIPKDFGKRQACPCSLSSSSLVTEPFSPVLLILNQRRSPPLSLQFQTAVLSVLCVMFLVWLSFVLNLLNVCLVWLPDLSLNLLILYRWLQFLSVSHI